MNVLSRLSNLCLGLIGFRGQYHVRCRLQFDRKFFSASQLRGRRDDDWLFCEDYDKDDPTPGQTGPARLRVEEKNEGVSSDIESIENPNFISDELEWCTKAGDAMFRVYYENNRTGKTLVAGEDKIMKIIRRGIVPDFIFVYNYDFYDDFDDLILPYSILPISCTHEGFKGRRDMIGLFNFFEVYEISKRVRPKIPITVFCDYDFPVSSVIPIWQFAANIGCEEFIFNSAIPPLRYSNLLRHIDMTKMKTTFMRKRRKIFSEVPPEQKVLLLPYGEKLMVTEAKMAVRSFHILGVEDAWDRGRVMLVVTKDPEIVDIMKDCLQGKNNLKFLKVPYSRRWDLPEKAVAVLFELLREYNAGPRPVPF